MATNLEVEFNPAPEYLFDYLTADVQTAECIFDLVDNSIDAARAMMSGEPGRDNLPANYSGFKVEVTLLPDRITVIDNCSGISEPMFTKSAFRAGERSQHPYGIGHFGVGLKRALLKLGDQCTVETDNGKSNLRLTFTREELDRSEALRLPAVKRDSSGTHYTSIAIGSIGADTKRELVLPGWQITIAKNFSRRYGLFIRKGLVIVLNGTKVMPFAPQPVDNPNLMLQSFHETIHGVDVEIVAGVHEKYRFADKDGGVVADPENNRVHRMIAGEFGWYVVCNDRVILLEEKTHKTGWTTNWHNEYNGFVGWVHFRARDPSLLPWNTKKSDIVENHPVYEDAVEIMRSMVAQYRKTTPLTKSKRTAAKAANKPETKTDKKRAPTAREVVAGSASKKQLQSISTLLPPDANFASSLPKLAGLVHDCERLNIEEFPYASAVMLRTVFDAALRDYLKRYKHFVTMRDAVLDASTKPGQTVDSKARSNYSPPLGEMVRWSTKNPDVFPDAHGRACKQACDRFLFHLPVLNGVVHEEGGISNAGQVRTMRDEILQGLLHILGS